MGGKQKRAAKYRKWLESQNHLKQQASQKELTRSGSRTGGWHQATDDHLADQQPMPHQIQHEVLRHRHARKMKKYSRNTPWIIRKLVNVSSSFKNWPTWPCTLVLTLLLILGIFILLRSLIQLFVPPEVGSVDRSALYSGLRMALPRPIFKFIRVVDYLFTSPVLAMDGLQRIIYPPEEIHYHR